MDWQYAHGIAQVELSKAKTENKQLRAALTKLYHLGPRPWMQVEAKPTWPEWDAAMSEIEALLGVGQTAGD